MAIRKTQLDLQNAAKPRQQQLYEDQSNYSRNNNHGGYKGKNYDLNYKGKQSQYKQQQ